MKNDFQKAARTTLSALLLGAGMFSGTAAFASNCQVTGATPLERALSRENCITSRMQSGMDAFTQRQQAQQQKIRDLQNQIANAPAERRAKLNEQLQAEQNRYLDSVRKMQQQRQEQINRLNALKSKYANLPQAEKDKLNAQLQAQKNQLAGQISQFSSMTQQQRQQIRQFKQNNQQLLNNFKGDADQLKNSARQLTGGLGNIGKGW